MPKRDENVEWRSFHNEEIHSFYRSLSIVSVIKYKRLRWASHAAIRGTVETPKHSPNLTSLDFYR